MDLYNYMYLVTSVRSITYGCLGRYDHGVCEFECLSIRTGVGPVTCAT